MRKKERIEISKNGRKKPPIKTERLSCDDFTVEVDGEEYHPHLDEWIEYLPIRQFAHLREFMEMVNFSVPEGEKLSWSDERFMGQYNRVVRVLSGMVYNWNLTDDEDKPLPRPYKNEEVLSRLSLDELQYIVVKIIGGRTEEAKNDSPPSPDT